MKERMLFELANEFLRDVLQPNPQNRYRLVHQPRLGLQQALRDLMRLAILPLQAEASFGWATGEDLPRLLDEALPQAIWDLLYANQALPRPNGGRRVWVDLRETPAISFPWNYERMAKSLCIDRWQYHPDNHKAVLYRPIGVLTFYNGLHSAEVGILRREGILEAEEVDMTLAFKAGLRVVWNESTPVAELVHLQEAFAHPGYGLLWALGGLFASWGVQV